MANIDITDQGGGSLSNGVLQLENGVAMDTTLRYVADQLNTKSQLLLATNATTVEGTLKIKTANVEYLDVEDIGGNNRFTISKAVGSQKVDLDFASNPTGSTTIVGAIRTYKDGISLSNTMVFREDGNVGIGETTSPSGLLHVDGGASVPRMILDADTNVARIFSFRTNDTQRWAFRIDDNETGTNAGSNFAIRRYNDAGTFIDAPFNITRSSGNIGINTATTTAAKVTIKGSGSTSGTTSLLVQDSGNSTSLSILDDHSTSFILEQSATWEVRNAANNRFVRISGINKDITTTGNITAGIAFFVGSLTIGNYSDSITGWLTSRLTLGGDNTVLNSRTSTGSNADNALRLLAGKAEPNYRNGVVYISHYGNLSTAVNYSAQLQVDSTTAGFLPPRMTTAQKNAIVTPAAGLVVYDTTLNKLCVYTTAWETITSV